MRADTVKANFTILRKETLNQMTPINFGEVKQDRHLNRDLTTFNDFAWPLYSRIKIKANRWKSCSHYFLWSLVLCKHAGSYVMSFITISFPTSKKKDIPKK